MLKESIVIFAPYGGSTESLLRTISLAFSASIVGGSLILTFTVVDFQITLPALVVGGNPSTPTIVREGLHLPLRYMLATSSLEMGVTPS